MAVDVMELEEAVKMRVRQPFPTAWIASLEDPVIAGRLVAIEQGETEYGTAKIAILEQRDGTERAVWILQQVLRNEFARWQPQIGEFVAIGYHGLQSNPEGHDFHLFRVAVDRSSQEFDWSTVVDQVAPDANGSSEPAPKPAQSDDIPF